MIGWLAVAALAGPGVVVLGVAQDAGHPQAACDKTCCRDAFADPAAGHRVASLGIVDGDRAWLVDATPDLPRQLHELTAAGSELSGILLTHAHIGHYTGLMHLGREAMGASGVPVWAMPRMRGFLEGSGPWSQLVSLGNIAVTAAEDGVPVALGAQVTATPFLVPHRDELSETVGWRIRGPRRTVVWLPDIDKWQTWDTSLADLVAGADTVFVDGTFFADGEVARDMAEIPHPFVVETVGLLSHLPAEERHKVVFVHFNHTNPLLDPDGEEAAAVRAAGFRVARRGDRESL
jgi:pyrroloquinoline quinone biosynthesis protein B